MGFQAVFPDILREMVDVGFEAAACSAPEEAHFKLAMTVRPCDRSLCAGVKCVCVCLSCVCGERVRVGACISFVQVCHQLILISLHYSLFATHLIRLSLQAAIEECGDELWRMNRWLEDVNKTVLFYGDNHLCPYHGLNDVRCVAWMCVWC